MNGCLETDLLVAMIEGRLHEDRANAVIAHVDECPSCAELVGSLGAIDTPRTIGRYELGEVLGSGAMGVVFASWDPHLQRRVALKLVRPEKSDPESRARMLQEARTLARVNHPNIVTVYDAGEHESEIFVATELIEGETMATWPCGRSVEEVVRAWVQAARGLAAAHAAGLVHRDVKPANVLVGHDGRVRVGDFGLALPSDSPASSLLVGTPAYMAPEQWGHTIDGRADQFALCVSLVEAVTAHRPSANDRPGIIDHERLSKVVTRGLRQEPAERYPSMDELADALLAAIAPRRKRWRVAAGAAGAVLIGGALLYTLVGREPRCEIAQVPHTVWTPAKRAKLAYVAPRIETWLGAWTSTSANACTTDDAGLRVRRQQCLAVALDRFDRLVTQLATTKHEALDAALLLDAIPAPSRCVQPMTDPAREIALSLQGALVQPLATRDRAGAEHKLRELLAGTGQDWSRVDLALLLMQVLEPDRGDELVTIAEQTRALIGKLGGDAGSEAIVDRQLARIFFAHGRPEEAIAALDRARRNARAAYGEDSLLEADIIIQLAGEHAHISLSRPEVAQLRDAAKAIYARYKFVVPELDTLGEPQAEVLIKKVTATLAETRTKAPNSEMLFGALYNVGLAYSIANRDEPALAAFREALATADKVKVVDARVVTVLNQLAFILADNKRGREALPFARRGIELARSLRLGSELGDALSTYGYALIEAGQPAAARPALVEALAIREKLREPAHLRAAVRFTYARALWPIDRKRAVELARASRVDTESYLETLDPASHFAPELRAYQEKRMARIDQWLKEHGG